MATKRDQSLLFTSAVVCNLLERMRDVKMFSQIPETMKTCPLDMRGLNIVQTSHSFEEGVAVT